MKIYANLDELVPHLGEIDGWLYVDEDRWAQNPAAAEIYLFAEEEAEYWDTHADGEDFDDARPPYIPAQLADRPIGILLESGTLYDVLWNLAKYVPDYTPEQLAHAVSFYQENDTFYEACGLTLAFHVWATWAERKDAWRLKERKAELDKALQQPLGEIWVASNRPVPAAELATQYGETQFRHTRRSRTIRTGLRRKTARARHQRRLPACRNRRTECRPNQCKRHGVSGCFRRPHRQRRNPV